MSRMLALARRLYGDDTCRLIFEPLVADGQYDMRGRSLAGRVRSYLAIVSTFVVCAPRATFGNLSARFVIDLTGRAVAFFMLAFALQWALGARLDHGRVKAWPPSFATTYFFMITPVIWRLRGEAVPVHQQRLLTFGFSAACFMAALVSAAPGLPLAAAMLLGTAWLTWNSWALFTAITREQLPIGPWLAGVYPACSIIVASAPIKLALGISLWQPWWPGDNLIVYLVGALVSFSFRHLHQGEAPYRKFFS